MAGKDIIMAKQKELKRLHVIHKAIEKVITQAEAARIAGLSERQIRRIAKRIREEGDKGDSSQIKRQAIQQEKAAKAQRQVDRVIPAKV